MTPQCEDELFNKEFEGFDKPKKECLHNWEYGYVGDLVIFCTKCNKDADDVYAEQDFSYRTHTCKNGQIIRIDK